MLKRNQIAALSLSAAAFVGILTYEGYKESAYIPVPGDVPTIGFGTTDGVKMGDRTNPVAAVNRAIVDVAQFEGAIKQCVKVPLYQYEYDAYVSLAYNIGSGAFCRSTLVRKLNKEDYTGACYEILRWNKMGNQVLPGLTRRRQGEFIKCMGGQ
jgi:lysozyme